MSGGNGAIFKAICNSGKVNGKIEYLGNQINMKGDANMGSSKIIECIYEDGVFKPLGRVDLKQGTRLLIKVGREDLSKYWGILGKASAERLAELEEEAQL